MVTKSEGWCVTEDPDVVMYQLNETHTLYISRVEDGIRLRVIENDERVLKPTTMFLQFISDAQMGILFPRKWE